MNVIFDIGKVLIDFEVHCFAEQIFGEETGKIIIGAMWDNPCWCELDRGILSDEEIIRMFVSSAPQYERQIRLMFSKLGDIPVQKSTTIPLIKKLKNMGYGVYYLSNYFEYLMHTAPEALSFIEYTDGGVFSCHEHLIKPDPRIYARICEKYSLIPSECIFIDDTLKNVTAAVEFGMKGIHYTGQSADELCARIASF